MNHSYRIGGVMASVLASGALNRGFEPQLGQTEDFKIDVLLLCWARSTNEQEQRLVGSESG